MCLMGDKGRDNRLMLEPIIAILFIVAFFVGAVHGQSFDSVEGGKANWDFVRWVATQGGFLGGWLITLYFYRRDFQSKLADKTQQIEVLLRVFETDASSRHQLLSSNEKLTSAVHALAERRNS